MKNDILDNKRRRAGLVRNSMAVLVSGMWLDIRVCPANHGKSWLSVIGRAILGIQSQAWYWYSRASAN